MILKVRTLKLLTGRPVAILHEDTAKKLSIYEGDRIRVKNNHSMVAVVNVAKGLLKTYEISLSKEIMGHLEIREGHAVEVNAEPPPKTTHYILQKLRGAELNYEQLHAIVGDIVHNTLTEAETAYFISGVFMSGMTAKEISNFTKAMVIFGKQLKLPGAVYDKHSIGGVAGNRTTPLIVSICAAASLIMPKTSSRAITSAAGTADVIETFSKVEFSIREIKSIINKAKGCMVWGGALGLAPADDKIIQVERLIGLDPEAQLIASILSKKLAVRSKGVLIDISYGPSAKVHTKSAADKLGNRFQKIAKILRLNLEYIATDGSQPIGNGIGPVLEARDVLSVLARSPNRPLDLERRSVELAGIVLEMAKKAKKGKGKRLAKEILESGKAHEKFKQIISAQGGVVDLSRLKLGKFCRKILSPRSGRVQEINNKGIASVAKSAGCPSDKGAGVYLHVHKNHKVKKGEPLVTVYAETKDKLGFARRTFDRRLPITLI